MASQRPMTEEMRDVLARLERKPIRWGDCGEATKNRLRALRDRGLATITTGSGPDQLHEITDAGVAALRN